MDDYRIQLLQRLDGAFLDVGLRRVLDDTKAIVGPANVPGFLERAHAAYAALRAGEPVDSQDLAALEDVLRLRRPALVCKADGSIRRADDALRSVFPGWDAFARAVEPRLSGVARLDVLHWSGETWHVGTGFLVRPDVLLTNRHVLSELTGASMELRAGIAVARFGYLQGAVAIEDVAVTEVIAYSWTADLALLRLGTEQPAERVAEVADEELKVGQEIAVIGHPADDNREHHFKALIFGERFGLKHASPGIVTRRHPPGDQLEHDASTLKGNSGSPVFDLASAKVVGVHFSGSFFEANTAEGVATTRQFVVGALGGS
jgi:V8-like Glu-specific endopeptidase